MAIPLDPKQLVSFEEVLTSQMMSQDALFKLLIEKGIFSEDEFLKLVGVVDRERKRWKGNNFMVGD